MDQAGGDEQAKKPGKPGGFAPKTAAERKAERLRAALRANLARRKAQARGRDSLTDEPDETPC